MEQSDTTVASATLPSLVEGFECKITREMRYRTEDLCRLAFLFSDSFAILGALVAAYYIRFDFLGRLLPPDFILAPSGGKLANYAPSILLGAAILFLILFGTGAYDSRVLLRFRRSFFLLLKSVLIWFIAFAGVSFILAFDADLSRVYIIICSGLLLTFLGYSRFIVQRVAAKSGLTVVLRRQILFVDWTAKTARIARAVINDRWNPYEIVACAPNRKGHFTSPPPAGIPALRSYQEVSLLCERGLVDTVILADGRRANEDVLELARECEKKMVDFMVIPSGFQILLSCLELNTISGVPLLGVTKLPLNNPFNWALKRAIDIVGSLVGLILSAPIIALYALLVYLESPGPVFYRQLRVGRRGRHFHILKIRSMKLDAEHTSGPR